MRGYGLVAVDACSLTEMLSERFSTHAERQRLNEATLGSGGFVAHDSDVRERERGVDVEAEVFVDVLRNPVLAGLRSVLVEATLFGDGWRGFDYGDCEVAVKVLADDFRSLPTVRAVAVKCLDLGAQRFEFWANGALVSKFGGEGFE